jgi:glycosyltransferase A (GT-A) superfamily protein (DUF2064 family)
MRPNAVILFAGDARREETEKGLPPRFLARLHAELAAIIQSVDDVDLYVATDRGTTFVLDGPRFTSQAPQRPLGEKVEDAITSCFAAGYGRVAVVAGDVAGLTRELVVDALARTKPVIGRSPDGGFYLAAFSAPPNVAWTSLPWSTGEVHDALFAQLDDPHVLPSLHDIDSFEDALKAIASVADPRKRARLRSLLTSRSPLAATPLAGARPRPSTVDRPRPPPAV